MFILYPTYVDVFRILLRATTDCRSNGALFSSLSDHNPPPQHTLETKKHRHHDRLVGNSVFGFRFLGRPEFGIPLPSSEFRNFPAENQIGKPENRSSQKSEFRFRFFRNSGIPLITYIGTQYIPILYYNLRK